ncbi:MAG: phenylacetate--CoA ligase family protein [Proteobacteria bacterium]|nr:phenylacetate--CoA ligase family protein [Pseudomonadota bacterium]
MPFYARLYSRRVQPALERAKGKATPVFEQFLAESQTWEPERLEAWRWGELEQLLTWAVVQVPFYRRWFQEGGITPQEIAAARDLGPLPIISKQMIQAAPEDFRAAAPPEGSYAKSTGGTLGQPLHFLVNPLSDQWRMAVSRRGYAWAGCVPGRKQVHLWSGDLVPLPWKAGLKRGLHRLAQRQRFVDYYRMLGPEEVRAAMEVIDRFGPDCLVAYPSGAEALAGQALDMGWRPRKPLLSVLTGAERLLPQQRQLIERALGCPCFETYGSREFMLMASECPAHQGLHVSAENVILEVDAPPGEVGELLVTDLHNYAQPFIRYQGGDLASWLQGPCACGRTLPRLTGVEGRVMDAIRTPAGGRLTGLFFPHLLKDYPAIAQYQIVQPALDRVVLRLVLKEALTAHQEQVILAAVRKALPGVDALIEPVGEIETTPSGKVRITIGLGES